MMLKIKDVKSLNMLVEALAINGYKIKTETVYREWP